MKALVLSPAAVDDLDRIYDYTEEKWGQGQAEDYIVALRGYCEALAAQTKRGRKIIRLRSGYTALAFRSHFVIYAETEKVLTVIRILHRRMNIAAHL
ncbi:type II toxin-antitoxin system RelE/ParE family toxin [Rhizobium leguminosarum bv. viciae 248]|uniref:type II toxin-antitoxin system RelE/ParE family toxin n=1 Tax=Rhizobium leguminosarum TaxID=384 RepID=UPI00035D008C|nr:type II toxin-antitoxin system RelE/ParE family toxin [Rhizobium leguminosarum]MCA2409710.1 type II toxin-antitoxin system RelE/ParE family toxin [Rhizobium leguminosarum]NKM62399.1 type II toxin-antitoxin system RelE/ParE family toxin [Rhizobium leguminosarum bv. viciae]QHW26776.1 type II toxin-antitoxin system RelE/ParE family toxin [Rhizobium leguminosarum bv. viciae 248]